MTRILVLGGYGTFGRRIARALAAEGFDIIVAGRSEAKAAALARTLPAARGEAAALDVTADLAAPLARLRPAVVVDTCGPFQARDYRVARACIAQGVHYVDLADGRDFVTGIVQLDADARRRGVAAISGASTVPALTSAVVEHYRHEFAALDALRGGIGPGQRTARGLATTRSILCAVGRPLSPFAGATGPVYGWQGLYRQAYPGLGRRWMANCDIPDLDLLPRRYGLRAIRFSGGLELGALHLGLWVLSWLVRLGVPLALPRHAGALLAVSNWCNRFGTADGGLHLVLRGADTQGRPYERRWFLLARDGDGPQVPTAAATAVAARLATGQLAFRGAAPCVGLVPLAACLERLRGFAIEVRSDARHPDERVAW